MFWRSFLGSLFAAFLVSAFACSAALAQTVALRLATTPNDSGAEAYYAADMGFFKKAGLDVAVTTMTNGGLIAAGVAAGSFDIAQASLPSLTSAHDRGLPFVMIAPGALYSSKNRTTAVVVANSSTMRSAKELSGKTVAVNGLHNIAQVAVMAWVDGNGGDSKTIKFLELPDSEAGAAIAVGRVDAANMSEPSLHGALESGERRVLGWPFDGVGSRFVISGWFCTSDFARAHPDVVTKFQSVMAQTARWANTHHAESAAILEKYTKMKASATMARVDYGEQLIPAQIQPLVDASVKYNGLKTPIAASELLWRSPQ